MAIIANGVKTMQKISVPWVECTNITDRRTDDNIQRMSSRSLKRGQNFFRFIKMYMFDGQSDGRTNIRMDRQTDFDRKIGTKLGDYGWPWMA